MAAGHVVAIFGVAVVSYSKRVLKRQEEIAEFVHQVLL